MDIKKNDMVVVIAGNYRGAKGKVLKVFPKQQRAIIEGVNLRKRHTKPSQKNQQGGIIEQEAPVHLSNIMIIDPKTGEPTRIGHKIIIDDKTGKKRSVRVSKISNQELPNS